MYKKGDFHIHSCESDGELRPGEIVLLAKERNIDIISITDHNRVSGNKEAVEVGKIFGVKVIPGIELSTRYKGNKVHILGYFTNNKYKEDRFINILNNINKRKFKLVNDELNNKCNLIFKGGKLTVKSGVDFLHYFDAKVVLAHPVFLPNKIFLELLEYDFDGIEARYYRNKDEDTEYFINIARERNIIYTAGSDFHKISKIDIKHGTLGQIYLEEEELKFVEKWFKK